MEKNFVNNQFTNIQQNNLNPQNQFQKGNMSVLNHQGFNMMYYDNMDASQNKLTNNNASMLKNFNPMININTNTLSIQNNMQIQMNNNNKFNININMPIQNNNMNNIPRCISMQNNNMSNIQNDKNLKNNNNINNIPRNLSMQNNNIINIPKVLAEPFNNNMNNNINNLPLQNNKNLKNNIQMQINNQNFPNNSNINPNGIIKNNIINNINMNNQANTNMNFNMNNINMKNNMNLLMNNNGNIINGMNHINSNNTFQINPKNINNNINIQMNNNFGGKNMNNMNNMNMNQNNMIMNNNNNKNGIQNINTTNLLNQLLLLFNKYFSDSNLSKLQTESQILAFFSKGEKKCISFIYSNFYEKEKYTSNIYKELENLFNNNPNLNHDLTKGINEIIKMIPFQNFDNLEKYNEALISVFGNVEVPYFLIRNDFENLKQFLQYSNRNNETSTMAENIKKKNFGNNATKIFIDYYEIIRNNILNPFEGFDKKIKLELFKLFLIINIRTLGKWYIDKHFIYFFESNINMINKYFENKLTFKEIKDFLDNNHANSTNLKEFLYQNISPSLGNNINNIYNIISSFFYILFYKFKDNNKPELISNIGNTHLSVAFKNFVIFFDNKNQIFANTGKNLFQLLTDLIAYEIYYLATYNKFNLQTNELYDFDRIDTILAEDEGYKILRESNIAKYPNMVNDDVLTLMKKNVANLTNKGGYIEKYRTQFKLIPINIEALSNSITILVDGIDLNSYKEKFNWKDFTSKFNGETIFYVLNWINEIKDLNNENASNKFSKLKAQAKIGGKILAYIIFSEKFFKNFEINLVGLNCGCILVKKCLNELYKLNINSDKKIYIKNVIFIDATINIINKSKWIGIFEYLIIDKLIHCYSEEDNVNDILKKDKAFKSIIGISKLNMNYDEGNYDLIYNHNLSPFEFGVQYYDLSIPPKSCFASYNDL